MHGIAEMVVWGCVPHPGVCKMPLLLYEERVHVITEVEVSGFRSVPLDASKTATSLVESDTYDD